MNTNTNSTIRDQLFEYPNNSNYSSQHCPKPNSYDCQLIESEYLPPVSFKKFWVVVGVKLRLKRLWDFETLGHCPKPNSYEWELIESEYLPSISFEKFRVVVVGGGGGELWF